MKIKIQKRRTTSSLTSILVFVAAVIIALLLCAVALKIMGYSPFEVFGKAYQKTFLQRTGMLECAVTFVPLSLCALSVVIAAKAGLWNIGTEGQFYVGAWTATVIALSMPNAPGIVVIPLMIVCGALAAGLFCYIAVLPKQYLGISEIMTTVLLNSVVLYFIRWTVYSSRWKDTTTVAAQTFNISDAAALPTIIPNSRVHLGVLVAIIILICVAVFLNRTVAGFELKMVGNNANGAKYAGVNITRVFFLSMLLAGTMAGAAGALEISGVTHRLQATISSNYGYTAFAIAWVARLNIAAIAILSYIFAGFVVAGYKMQMMSLPYTVTTMMTGLILILVLGAEGLCYYKIHFLKKGEDIVEHNVNSAEAVAAAEAARAAAAKAKAEAEA